MNSNYGSKDCAMPYQLNLETDLCTDHASTCIDSPLSGTEWKKNRFSNSSYIICRAYDEPCTSHLVENILMGRMYIID